MRYFVYLITCLPTGKKYVGITGRTVEWRWGFHIRDAYNINKRHKCRSLADAIVAFSPTAFTVETIATSLSVDKIAMLEKRFIQELGTLSPGGMNLNSGGKKSFKLSDETKRKISVANSRPKTQAEKDASQKASLELCERDPEHLRRLHRGLSASWQDPEKKAARITAMKAGHANSDYVRPAWSDESKEKLRAARTASWKDPEKRAKRTAGIKAWWARRKKLGVVS